MTDLATKRRGEMEAMVSCARTLWHSYLRLRRAAAKAEADVDLSDYRSLKARSLLQRRRAIANLDWARRRQAEIQSLNRSMTNAA